MVASVVLVFGVLAVLVVVGFKEETEMILQPDVRRRVEELAAELRQLLYGPTGAPVWGTKFTALEDEACAVGDEVTRCLMSQALQEQAERAAAAPTAACVVCGRDSPSDDIEPRVVQTRRGEVIWRENKHYCRKCRRDFFPSQP